MPLFCWFHHFLDSRAEIVKFFRWYFGRNDDTKRHFEINWPLSCRLLCLQQFYVSGIGTNRLIFFRKYVPLFCFVLHSNFGNYILIDLQFWIEPLDKFGKQQKLSPSLNSFNLIYFVFDTALSVSDWAKMKNFLILSHL